MTPGGAVQLPLGLALRDGATFGNFVPGDNGHALAALTGGGSDERVLFLAGPAASGKTHLLQARVRDAAASGAAVAYLPLREARMLDPRMLADLERLALVCLDDVDAVAGDAGWEEALFHLHNRLDTGGVPLLISARAAPSALPWGLPDLASRWRAAVVLDIAHLDEAGCREAMRARARARGFDVPDDVLDYVLRRERRDMHTLSALLERLDRSSLAARRRITVPFVKSLLADPGA